MATLREKLENADRLAKEVAIHMGMNGLMNDPEWQDVLKAYSDRAQTMWRVYHAVRKPNVRDRCR